MRRLIARNLDFVGNITIMMSGKILAALIALGTMPIVARLFEPGHFGAAAIFASIVSMASNVGSLRYGATIVLPDEETEAAALRRFSLWVAAFISSLIFALLGVYTVCDFTISALELIGVWRWLLPLAVFLATAISVQESWLVRAKAFKSISSSLVAGNSCTGGSRIAMGAVFGSSTIGLVAGEIIGLCCRAGLMWFSGGVPRRQSVALSLKRASELARRYADFPKFNAPAGLIFAIGQNLPVVLFGTLFGPVTAGFYAMANRLSQMPVSIVANSVRGVFLQRAAETRSRGGTLRRAFLFSTGALALLGFLPFLLLSLYGQPIATYLLGDRWFEAGGYLQILAPWLFMVWIAAPCNAIYVVLREQRLYLALQTLQTALRIGAFGLAFIAGVGPSGTLKLFVVTTVIGIFFVWTGAFLLTRTEPPTPNKNTITE